MKYDDIEMTNSVNYEKESVEVGKIAKKRNVKMLDAALIGSVCGVLISMTVLISRLMSTGILSGILG